MVITNVILLGPLLPFLLSNPPTTTTTNSCTCTHTHIHTHRHTHTHTQTHTHTHTQRRGEEKRRGEAKMAECCERGQERGGKMGLGLKTEAGGGEERGGERE